MGKAKFTKVSVDLKTPFLSVKGDWQADEGEQQALPGNCAWNW